MSTLYRRQCHDNHEFSTVNPLLLCRQKTAKWAFNCLPVTTVATSETRQSPHLPPPTPHFTPLPLFFPPSNENHRKSVHKIGSHMHPIKRRKGLLGVPLPHELSNWRTRTMLGVMGGGGCHPSKTEMYKVIWWKFIDCEALAKQGGNALGSVRLSVHLCACQRFDGWTILGARLCRRQQRAIRVSTRLRCLSMCL